MRRATLTTSLVWATGVSGCDRVAVHIEAYLWPVGLVYVSLAVLIACPVYLVCVGRT